MRVAKTDVIAGLPAGLARSIVRRFRGSEMVTEAGADLLEWTGIDPGLSSLGWKPPATWKGPGRPRQRRLVGLDDSRQCPGDGQLRETDQQKNRGPARRRAGGTGAPTTPTPTNRCSSAGCGCSEDTSPEIDRSATSISNSPTAAGLPTRQPWPSTPGPAEECSGRTLRC